MRVELLTIGDELLDGDVHDQHGHWLCDQLTAIGVRAEMSMTVRDCPEQLVDSIRAIATRADICICTGGLGPTTDDLTVDALATAAGVNSFTDSEVLRDITARMRAGTARAEMARQARIPGGAEALRSEVGTAPGIAMMIDGCQFFALPGVPREMTWHFETHVLDRIKRASGGTRHRAVMAFSGIGESGLGKQIKKLGLDGDIEVSYQSGILENLVKLTGSEPLALESAARKVAETFPEDYLGEGETKLASAVLRACRGKKLTVGAAESCTGGLIGASLTDIPGSSSTFLGSIVSYSNSAKQGILGVKESTLIEHGAVSEQTAIEMVKGAQSCLECDIAVAVTGIAGPGGGTPEKPVGTVWFAWVGPGWLHTERRVFSGDRERIRQRTLGVALDGVRRRYRA